LRKFITIALYSGIYQFYKREIGGIIIYFEYNFERPVNFNKKKTKNLILGLFLIDMIIFKSLY